MQTLNRALELFDLTANAIYMWTLVTAPASQFGLPQTRCSIHSR